MPSPPRASAPAGRLPPGSAPGAAGVRGPGWRDEPVPRLPERRSLLHGSAGRASQLAVLPGGGPEAEDVPGLDRELDRAAPRLAMLLQGLLPALVCGGLALASAGGRVPLAVVLFLVQLVVAQSVLALVEAPAELGAAGIAAAAVAASDVVVLVDDGRVRGLAGVVALSLIASLLHQLLRRKRTRVTESMADTLVAVVVGAAAACLLAMRALEGGPATLRVALVASAACLLAGRIGDRVVAQPVLAVGSTRGWPGLLLGLGAGVAAAVAVAQNDGVVIGTQAALLGLVCAATVAAADLAVDLGAAELRDGDRDARRVAALVPTGLALPAALLGPIALVAGHLVLR